MGKIRRFLLREGNAVAQKIQAERGIHTRLNDERSTFTVCPFAHRAVVVSRPVITQELENEHSVRRTDSTLSISHNFLVGGRPDFFKHRPKFVCWLDRLMIVISDEVQPFEMNGAGYASRPGISTRVTAIPLAI